MKNLILCFCLLFSVAVYAGGSKMINVDLDDKGTQIVKAELDLDDLYYYIDTNACICWVAKILGGSNTISVFDCKNLSAYPKLEQYLSKCEFTSTPVVAVPVNEVLKAEEPKATTKEKKAK